jgi:signal transduction histidine kinase
MVDERSETLSLVGGHGMQADLEKGMKELMTELNRLADVERARHVSWAGEQERSRLRIKECIIFGAAMNIFLAAGIAILLMSRISRRIDRLVDNARRLAKRKELRAFGGGNDEIAELDRVFHEMANALAEAERVKQEFLSIISHELRSPLSSIQGTLTLLDAGAYGQLNDQGRMRVTNAEASATRLINLINELLEIQKMSVGKLKMNFESTSLGPVLQRSIEMARVLAERKSIKLESNGIEGEAYVDGARIEQVLVNLLSNAIKYSPNGTTVSVKVVKEGELVEFRIKDEGPGISESLRETIFERYEQGEGTEKDGTGLGLPICKAIVEEHRGQIGLETELGKGSTFWFRVPK